MCMYLCEIHVNKTTKCLTLLLLVGYPRNKGILPQTIITRPRKHPTLNFPKLYDMPIESIGMHHSPVGRYTKY